MFCCETGSTVASTSRATTADSNQQLRAVSQILQQRQHLQQQWLTLINMFCCETGSTAEQLTVINNSSLARFLQRLKWSRCVNYHLVCNFTINIKILVKHFISASRHGVFSSTHVLKSDLGCRPLFLLVC